MKRYSGSDPSKAPAPKPAKLGLVSPALLYIGAVGLAVAGLISWLVLTQPGSSGGNGSLSDAIGGPFQLTDQNGRRVDQAILKGHWTAVFFGYVSCPDVCPATMQALGAAQDRLGADGAALHDVFITVDPARDTPAQLKAWIDQPGFPKNVTALTGSPAEIASVAKAYRIFYQKENKPTDYRVDHTAAIFLMDPKGHFVAPLTYDQGPEKLARDIRDAMHGK